MEDGSTWSSSNLLQSAQSVTRELEALKNEHEVLLSAITNPQPDQQETNEVEKEEEQLLAECKTASLSNSLNTLNSGLTDANLILAVLQYISSLEGDKGKLKAQVRRLADENNWLRQELQKSQQALQDAEIELNKTLEEKQHLSYLLSLPKTTGSGVISNSNIDNELDNEEMNDEDTSVQATKGSESESKETSNLEHYQKLHQYAVQHMHQGRHDVAVSLCKKAVQELEQSHGRYHPERVNMLNIMVVIYREQGKVKESVKLLQEVLEIREKINGRHDQTVASTLNNLSVLHGKLGDYKTAEQYCRRALEIRQKLLGPSHTDVAQQLINLATLCQHLGKYEEVEWYYQRALEIYHTEYGPDDPHVIKTLNYLGKCYMKQGNLEAAENVFKKVRNAVQAQETSVGQSSREESNSPIDFNETQLMSSEPTKLVKKSQSSGRLQNMAEVKQHEERRPSAEVSLIPSQRHKQGRNSISSNVLKFFKWGSASES